ncbi:MAG TPA: glycosyltransferase, partial [Thermoleophilaceae bacterium]|nr:glycosyltransferase [Thermoleophilaceae bacterium]
AMPSLHEGLGLPVLEAMAAGTPVVSSNRGALPETCGDAALVVDPDDHEAFAAALVRAALDAGEHQRLAAAGRERAAGFTWRRTAERVDELLEPLLG